MSYAFRRLSTQLAAPATRVAWRRASPGVAMTTGRVACVPVLRRPFGSSLRRTSNGYDDKARALNQKGLDEQEQEVQVREHQIRRPWHRDGADKPPVSEDGEADNSPVKGKLLTTPTRLLKLILPLPIRVEKDKENNSKDYGRSISANDEIQPLALLVHPQQPLSYVERLIQAELPAVVENGTEKMPNVYFRAEDTTPEQAKKRGESPESPHVASYSGLGHEAEEERHDKDKKWVRWSSSTEMGDFIRDAARGREFTVEIEGYNVEMRVGVPSFNDRTHYMRLQLRKMSRRIDRLAGIKRECDKLAHRGAHRLAKGGFGLLGGWWAIVYYITFQTEYGWDLVEPITYLAGLATIMGGYLWFLYISRDLSYKAAMNLTVSRRQSALYEAKGFDVQKWEALVQEANALRREIKTVAVEYDVDWDETKDLGSEKVKDVLEKERKKTAKRDKDEDEEEEDEDESEPEKTKEDKKDGDKEEGEERREDGQKQTGP